MEEITLYGSILCAIGFKKIKTKKRIVNVLVVAAVLPEDIMGFLMLVLFLSPNVLEMLRRSMDIDLLQPLHFIRPFSHCS